ncbi:protein of unknown function [Nitrospina watsonii]|uniref:Uncharacterized protein n=1 Tax=Nitrospina watsonii TaxID=1323948 RepID=A0ABM9HAI1_9BACT|nr:protein of unknown function [Nitrospina watsonii]
MSTDFADDRPSGKEATLSPAPGKICLAASDATPAACIKHPTRAPNPFIYI